MNPSPDISVKEKVISAARDLKPIRSNVTRVLKILDDPDASAAKVAGLVSMDQVLTAEVLKVANSALLGYGRNCASIHEGVVRLGMNRMKVIALGVGAADSMSGTLQGYSLGGGDLMRHAVSTATIALWLAQTFGTLQPDETYVAGLLHDIGKLLLDRYLLRDRDRLKELLQKRGQPLWMIEAELFGINHAAAGGLVATHWRFPLSLVDAIESHHEPHRARKDPVTAAVVNLANAFSPNDSGRADFIEGRYVHESTMEILNLDASRLEKLRHDCQAAMKVGSGLG